MARLKKGKSKVDVSAKEIAEINEAMVKERPDKPNKLEEATKERMEEDKPVMSGDEVEKEAKRVIEEEDKASDKLYEKKEPIKYGTLDFHKSADAREAIKQLLTKGVIIKRKYLIAEAQKVWKQSDKKSKANLDWAISVLKKNKVIEKVGRGEYKLSVKGYGSWVAARDAARDAAWGAARGAAAEKVKAIAEEWDKRKKELEKEKKSVIPPSVKEELEKKEEETVYVRKKAKKPEVTFTKEEEKEEPKIVKVGKKEAKLKIEPLPEDEALFQKNPPPKFHDIGGVEKTYDAMLNHGYTLPFLLKGEKGSGKTLSVEDFAYKNKLPIMHIRCTPETTDAELIEHPILTEGEGGKQITTTSPPSFFTSQRDCNNLFLSASFFLRREPDR